MKRASGQVPGKKGIYKENGQRIFLRLRDRTMDPECRDREERAESHQRLLEEAERIGGVGFWEWDLAEDEFIFSDNGQRLYGIERRSFSFREWIDLVHPDDRGRVGNAFEDALNGTVPYDTEHRIIRADNGEVRFIYARGGVVCDSTGKPRKMYGIAHDITERKRSEEALRQNEALLRQIIDLIPHPIFVKDKSGKFLLLNKATADLFGREKDELLGKKSTDFHLSESERQLFYTDDLQVIETGQTRFIYEEIFPHHSGRKLVMQTTKIPIAWPGLSEYASLGIAVDLTERKQTEELLRRYERILSATPDAVSLIDKDYTYRIVNRTYLDRTGKSYEDIIDHCVADIVGREVFENLIREKLDRCLAGETIRYQSWFDYERAGRRFMDVTYYPYWGADRLISGVVVSARDITEVKLAEEALRESEERYRSFFENSLDGIMVTVPDGRILAANPSACRIFGYTQEEICKLGRSGLVDLSDPVLPKLLEERSRTGKYRGTLTHIRKDGTRFPAEVSCALFRSKQGKDLNILMIRDVTEQKRLEGALRLSEQYFRLTFDQAPIGVAVAGLDFRLQRVNRTFCSILGYSENELLSLTFPEFTHPEDIENNMELVRSLLAGEIDRFQFEKRYVRKDGKPIWVRLHAGMIRNEDGKPSRLVALIEDITDRKQVEAELEMHRSHLEQLVQERTTALKQEFAERRKAQDALAVSEAHLRKAQEVANVGSWSLDVASNELRWSDELCRIFGIPSGKRLTYASFLETVHPEDREQVDKIWVTPLRGKPYDVEYRIIVGDTVKWVREKAEVEFNHEGRPLRGIGIVQDITECKRVEDALRKSEQRFRELVERSLTAISIHQDGRIIYRNPEHERLMGPLNDSVDYGSFSYVHHEDIGRVREIDSSLRHDESGVWDAMIRVYPYSKIGSPDDLKWVHLRTSRIEYEGREALLVNTMDVTRIRELEHLVTLQDKMSALGRISAGIAHEIRNPLGGLNMYMSALKKLIGGLDWPDDREQEVAYEIIEKMRSASNRIEGVIRRVLDFSRPSAPRLSLINISQPVEDALNLAAVTLRKNNVEVETNLHPNLPQCHADPSLMQHVLLNLINNSIEAMRNVNAPKHLDISSMLEKDRIVLRVSDSGPGIPEEIRNKIFDPFFSTKSDGMGIGLGLCNRIITDHGGSIETATSRWGGCEFKITLPINKGAKDT